MIFLIALGLYLIALSIYWWNTGCAQTEFLLPDRFGCAISNSAVFLFFPILLLGSYLHGSSTYAGSYGAFASGVAIIGIIIGMVHLIVFFVILLVVYSIVSLLFPQAKRRLVKEKK